MQIWIFLILLAITMLTVWLIFTMPVDKEKK